MADAQLQKSDGPHPTQSSPHLSFRCVGPGNAAISSVSYQIDGGAKVAMSDRGANLWAGSWNASGLPDGAHTLDVSVTDANGKTGSDQIKALVNQAGSYTPPTRSFGPENNVLSASSIKGLLAATGGGGGGKGGKGGGKGGAGPGACSTSGTTTATPTTTATAASGTTPAAGGKGGKGGKGCGPGGPGGKGGAGPATCTTSGTTTAAPAATATSASSVTQPAGGHGKGGKGCGGPGGGGPGGKGAGSGGKGGKHGGATGVCSPSAAVTSTPTGISP